MCGKFLFNSVERLTVDGTRYTACSDYYRRFSL